MAVWLIVYGKNGLGQFAEEKTTQYLNILKGIALDEIKILDSLKDFLYFQSAPRKYYEDNRQSIEAYYRGMTTKKYEDYLHSIGKSYLTVDSLITSFIDDAEARQKDNIERFNKAYDEFNRKVTKSEWKIARQNSLGVTFINNLNYFDTSGLSIRLYNDVLSFHGPFEIFSKYFTFQKEISNQSREYYHQYFKSVLAAFKSDFILYAHEWSGMIDEEDNTLNSGKILQAVSSRISENSSLHNMNSFNFEILEPKSSFS